MAGPGAQRLKHAWVVSYGRFILRFRWAVIVLSVLCVTAGCFGAVYVKLNPDTKLFFDPASPELQQLEKFGQTYGTDDDVIFIVAPKEGDIFSREALGALRDVTDAGEELSFATRVVSFANYPFTTATGDDIHVEDLVPPTDELTDEAVAAVRAKSEGDRRLIGPLLSPDSKIALVDVILLLPDGEREAIPAIAAASHALADALERKYPTVEIRLTGSVIAEQALAEASQQDIRTLVPAMCLLVIATLWIGFRSASSMAATLAVVLMSMGIAVGAGGWLGMVLNNVTAGAPILTMTLAIADCVHILAASGHLRRKGVAKNEAIIESLRVNWWPVLMTTVTTAVSFLCMNFAESPPLRDMGTLVAIGVTAAWLLCITFFIALLFVLPSPKRLPILSDPRFMTGFGRVVIRYNRSLLLGSLVVVGFLAFGITQLKLNDDFFKYFSPDFQFRQDSDLLEQHGIGFHTILFSVESGKDGGVTDPEYLRKLDGFAEWMRKNDKVTQVSIFSDTVKRVDRSMNGDVGEGTIPDSQETVAQYLLFYEMALPSGVDLSAQLDIARSSSRVSVTLTGASANDIGDVAEAGRNWLSEAGLGGYVTGLSVLYSRIAEANIESMVFGTGLELVGISLLMILILRSFKIGLISLVPNLVPAIMAFGLWGWFGEEVNLAISVVAAMTFGVIVDDTIHSLTKYMHARRDLRLGPHDAVEYTFVAAGDPMILAGLTLILGFGVLSFSGFAVTQQMGLLSSLVLGLAIVADLVLLPPLLLLLDREKETAVGVTPAAVLEKGEAS